jgi:ssRNA-specific RNase YbeY (16S rRNA maturation enzyme)
VSKLESQRLNRDPLRKAATTQVMTFSRNNEKPLENDNCKTNNASSKNKKQKL